MSIRLYVISNRTLYHIHYTTFYYIMQVFFIEISTVFTILTDIGEIFVDSNRCLCYYVVCMFMRTAYEKAGEPLCLRNLKDLTI